MSAFVSRDAPAAADPHGLAAALAADGMACRVEPRERLAVLVPASGAAWAGLHDAPRRRALHQLATRFGFTHVAIEVGADADGAEERADGRDA